MCNIEHSISAFLSLTLFMGVHGGLSINESKSKSLSLPAVNIRALFLHLEKLSGSLNDRDHAKKKADDDDLEKEFVDTVIKLSDEIQGIFRYLEQVLRDRLTPRQFQMLQNIKTEDNPGLDIR